MQKINLFPVNIAITGKGREKDANERPAITFCRKKHRRLQKNLQSTIREEIAIPVHTHNIINLSETENLVTVMWANEQFDPNHPDTFFERVKN